MLVHALRRMQYEVTPTAASMPLSPLSLTAPSPRFSLI
jgi:hypothetical protein